MLRSCIKNLFSTTVYHSSNKSFNSLYIPNTRLIFHQSDFIHFASKSSLSDIMPEGKDNQLTPQNPLTAHPQPPYAKQTQESPGSEAAMNPKPDYGRESYIGHGRLKDMTAVITGGDSGIGRAVCVAFAKEGANIVCAYLNEHEDAKETEAAVKEAGRECLLVAADISTEEGCKSIYEATKKKFNHLDVLVNNAAFQGKSVSKFEELDWKRVEYTFKTNIISMFMITKLFLPMMKPGSSIINTGSIQAYDPSANILDYATTKGAIVNFTKGLAQELTEKGIRVNCVAPGPVWTPLVVASFSEDKVSKFGEKHPMKRAAQPVELSPAYVFLASHEAKYVSGEVLGVTGGSPLA